MLPLASQYIYSLMLFVVNNTNYFTSNSDKHFKSTRQSCKEIFKNIQIMTLYSQYMYSLILFVVNNKHIFTTNNEIHNHNTRNNNNLLI